MREIIHYKKKLGDWYIYPEVLAHENFSNAPQNVQKSFSIFKLSMHNVVSTWTNIAKIWLSLSFMGRVSFIRHCGKMYSRHFFPNAGLRRYCSACLGLRFLALLLLLC